MRRRLAVLIALAVTPAAAADLSVTTKIDAVTLYPDGATVTRLVSFEAPAGETTLIARDFPLGLDPSSIRLQGSGDADIAIGAVDAREVYVTPQEPDAALDASIRDLHDRRDSLEGDLAALSTKKSFIERFAASSDLFGSGDNAKPADPAALRAAWGAVGEDLASVNEAIRLVRVKEREIDEELARKEGEREGRGNGEQRMEVKVAVAAGKPVKGTLAISYLVGNAGWTARYDARLDTAAKSLELVRRAEVTQSTGEDWTDAALTISTARATAGAAPPALGTTLVSFVEPMPAPAPLAVRQRKEKLEEGQAMDLAGSMAAAEPASAPVMKAAVEREAVLDTGGFQSAWALPGRTTIVSGAATRALRLESASVAPEILARVVPALDTTAYLEASFPHQGDTPLFAGPVLIYRDGLYAGVANLAMTTKGEPVRLGFGADDSIKVERIAAKREQSQSGIVTSTKYDRRDFEIKLRNGRKTPVRLSIEEAVPVSEIEDIKVELTGGTTPPTVKDADGRRGVLVWTTDLAAGGTGQIAFGYTVSWPASRQITFN